MVMVAYRVKLNNGHSVFASESVHFEGEKEAEGCLKGRVRAETRLGGFDCRETVDGGLKVTAIWQIDLKVPKGTPQWAETQLKMQSVTQLARMKKLLLEKRQKS